MDANEEETNKMRERMFDRMCKFAESERKVISEEPTNEEVDHEFNRLIILLQLSQYIAEYAKQAIVSNLEEGKTEMLKQLDKGELEFRKLAKEGIAEMLAEQMEEETPNGATS